jgi:hypothetical protein
MSAVHGHPCGRQQECHEDRQRSAVVAAEQGTLRWGRSGARQLALACTSSPGGVGSGVAQGSGPGGRPCRRRGCARSPASRHRWRVSACTPTTERATSAPKSHCTNRGRVVTLQRRSPALDRRTLVKVMSIGLHRLGGLSVVGEAVEVPAPGRVSPPGSWRDPKSHWLKALDSEWYRALITLQDGFARSTMGFWQERGVRFGALPLTTGSVSSPMGLGSDSLPVSVDMFGVATYLARCSSVWNISADCMRKARTTSCRPFAGGDGCDSPQPVLPQ